VLRRAVAFEQIAHYTLRIAAAKRKRDETRVRVLTIGRRLAVLRDGWKAGSMHAISTGLIPDRDGPFSDACKITDPTHF
jgi:hypothetical protein